MELADLSNSESNLPVDALIGSDYYSVTASEDHCALEDQLRVFWKLEALGI